MKKQYECRRQLKMWIVLQLTDGSVHRAEDLANRYGVVLRTVYRAIQSLRDDGYDIKGSAGLGGGVRLSTRREAA